MLYKRIFLILLSTLCFSTFPKDIEITVYCDDSYPPYSYLENDQIKGIYTEILLEAFSRMDGYTITIKALPWKRGLLLLKSGKGFAIYPPYYRPNDRPFLDYSIPILSEEIVALCREEILNIPRKKWVTDYIGLNVGINRGFKSIPEEDVNKIYIQEFGNNKTNILKLGLGRIDCYVNDKIAMLWTLKKLKSNGKYDEGGRHSKLFVGATISSESGYLGFTNMNNDEFYYKEDFKMNFNQVIKNMQKSGEISKIVEKYITL